MEKGSSSGKKMANVMTGFEHVTTIPKFKRHKVSAVRDFLPGCRRGATTDLGLNRKIVVDQGKYSLSIRPGDGTLWYSRIKVRMANEGRVEE
ncbi:hypothetical protein J1N35_011777 [Gossypium stocksii]|uniref:Uncharacterized protein n=1 Tax=Gossypium stocksii TaxID=47602 RepID=A0A9D3W2N8_9ROSI|nr:hypothetical protein J1N35_011777 [Gossypium stocksii]